MNSLVMSADDVRGAARAEPVLQDIASAAVPLLGDIGSYKRLIGVRQ